MSLQVPKNALTFQSSAVEQSAAKRFETFIKDEFVYE
jgi:hypothetical protein